MKSKKLSPSTWHSWGKYRRCWWYLTVHHSQTDAADCRTYRSRGKVRITSQKGVESKKCLYNNYNCIIIELFSWKSVFYSLPFFFFSCVISIIQQINTWDCIKDDVVGFFFFLLPIERFWVEQAYFKFVLQRMQPLPWSVDCAICSHTLSLCVSERHPVQNNSSTYPGVNSQRVNLTSKLWHCIFQCLE